MDINELQRNWDELGRKDPFWAILSAPEKIDNNWDQAEFFRTGLQEIEHVLSYIDSLGITLSKKRALDFGCGVGRLTQALAPHFDDCCGVDIAPSMIGLARTYNQYGDRCKYYLNENAGLPEFEDNSWDFIYSNIVLQHMIPGYSKNYIREFLRILRPGGVLLFQIPAEPASPAPGAIANLPEEAFRARIKPDLETLVAKSGSRFHVTATVKNVSSVDWPGTADLPGCPINLGNHWLNDRGELLVLDDSRASLDRRLNAGEETQLHLVVTTPADPGRYILELDLVQELVAWFGNKGSTVARVEAQIWGDPAAVRADSIGPEIPPKIEMYGVPKEEVLDLVASGGGCIKDVIQNSMAGLEWVSFTYCVTKERETPIRP